MIRHVQTMIAFTALVGCVATPLQAQTASRRSANRWELEVHGGGMVGSQPTSGTGITAFPAGQSFTTVVGRPSRYISSWMFGDGAVLMNQIASSFTGIPIVARIAPLDSMLTTSSLERHAGGAFGVRFGRRLTRTVSAEFGIDSAAAKSELTASALDAIDTTRASFAPVLNGIVGTGGGVVFTNPNISAKTTLTDGNERETFITGAVRLDVPTGGMLTPYLTAGLGVERDSGSAPTATVVGNYQFLLPGSAPINETDTVKIHYRGEDRSLVTVVGGGVHLSTSGRHGLRADVRVYVWNNSTDSLVDATPTAVLGTPGNAVASLLTPSIQFSNTAAFGKSNLTGPHVADLATFEGSGRHVRTSFAVGYFFRF